MKSRTMDEIRALFSGRAAMEEYKKRVDTCLNCEFITGAFRCEKCGCYMKLKTKLKNAKCPIDKW